MKRIKQKLSKFTAMLLAVIMIVGMLPVTAFAAAVPVSGKVVDVTDVPVKAPSYGNMTAFTIQNITIEGATVVSAEETAANTLKVVLAGDTDPSVNLTVKFGVKTNNTTVSGTSTSVQLSGGVKSQTFTLIASVRQGSRPVTVATANYTIVFETEAVELVSVTPPTGEGIAFDSKTGAYVGREYSFTIAVDDAYDSRNMVAKVNDTTLENPVPENGVYTYTVVPEKGEMVITVEGVTAKEKWNVTLTDGSGYTIASSDTPYKGEDYTFTVTVDTDNYKIGAEGLAVLVNGEKDKVTDNGDGTYTIKALDGDKTVTVTGVVERENFVVNKPNVPGVTFNGADTVREGKDYTFTLAVDNAYKADNMVVTDKSGGTVTFANGTYTISNVTDAPEIVISGVVAKQRITVSLPTVNGLVIRGADQVFEGEDYSFTVSVKNGYSADNIVVTVNGNILTGNDGTYTISAVTAVPTISVTATVQKLPGDVTINKVTGNGSLNYIVFSDVNGKPIEGIETDLNGNEISVRLPKGFDLNGQIKAAFDLTDENNDGYPFVSTSDRTTGNNAYGSRFTEKYISLANGSATFVFYYYNNATGAVNDGGQTRYTIKLKVDNDLPVLANGVEPTASVTIAVGENYELNLSDIFTDADDTLLTYQYKVNDGNWTDCDASFSYTNELSGTYTLTFRAFDTKDYSEAVYTVTLTVEDSKENYEVQVTVPAGVEPTFYVSDETGVVGNVLEASNSLLSSKVYKVNVPSNVSYIAWRTSDGMGMHAAVSKDAELNLIKADFKATLVDQSVDTKAKFTVKYGELSALGKDNSFLLLDGITYTVSVTAGNSGYRNTERTEYRPVNGDNEIPLEQKYFTVIAPKDSVVSAGMLDGSYGYKFVEPISHETQGDTEVYKFRPMVGAGDDTRSTVPFIRVQRPNDPDAVTYWRWHDTWKDNFAVDGKTITVTEENLCMNDDGAHDADTVNRSFSPNDLDIGDIYMNINAQGYINLSKGGTKQLNMFRNWQAIEAYVNACVAQPDFHYEVIPLKGENVVSITPDTNNSGVATLKAENDGTALVLVTYDAMFSTKTAKGSGAGYGDANIFSAIWPERTGVFVVSVGKDGTAIKTNMTCNGKTFDAEHSPQFYTGTDGASVSFKPEDNCTVTVSRGYEESGKWRFGVFDGTGITTDADGNVTVSGLTTGRHIIRVAKGDAYTYQVVTAQQVTVEIKDQDGNPVTEDTPVMAGTKITVTFKGLTHPAQKLAKIYNYNPFVWLTNDKGGGYGESTVGKIGSYGFNGTPQRVTLTVPADWDSDTMTLQGTIRLGGFHGSPHGIGGHRYLDYTGRDMGNGTEAQGDSLGTLPTITLKVIKPVPATGVTLDPTSLAMRVTETKTLTAAVTPADSTEKMVWVSSNTAVATVDETGVVKAVGVGETTITVTVGSVSATCAVTVSEPIPVTEITLSHAFAKLEPNKQLYLSATVNDDATDKTVTWTSSDKKVAEVNESGVVTAVAVGTTVITAQAGNETAKCIITVEEKQDADNIATVYLSISHDAQFMMGQQSGKAMALQKLDVPYFDLSNYGLEAYEIPESDPDYGKVTALHLYIYATEVFYCGVSEDDAGKGYLKQKNILGTDVLTVSGGPGSALLKDFWGYDMNLNYYLNYRYPYYPGTDVGATCDRIVLSDDDIITVAHFTNMDFMSDPVSVFNYITLTMQEDTAVLQAYRAGADMGNGGSNTPVKAKLDVYYAKAGAMTSGNVTAWTKVGTTDENGQLQVNTLLLEPGDYVFAVAGRTGEVQTTKICSAPGGVVVKVLESADRNKVKGVVDLIKAIGTVTLESGDAITAARLAYETLAKPALQDAVSNYQTLLAAEAELKVLQEAKADQDAADAFAALVEDIGPVEATEACKAKIDAAKASYAALTETQMVLAAEAKATLDQAENAYANLVASEKDKAAAKAVQDLIAAIGTVTLDSETKIVAARDAYNALKEELKPLVENLDVLTTAENALAELKEEAKIDAVEQMIASIGVVTLESETAITDARKAYDALSDEQKEKVENADVLIEAEKVLAIFKMDKADSNKVYKDTGDYLEKQVKEHGLTVNSIGGDWIVLGLERAGRKTPNINDYYNVVIKFVQEEINNNEQLHRAKSTENSRVILALTAAGYDVTNVTGHNLLMGLTDMEYVKGQGVNGPIWALIAFDSHNYEIPVNNKAVEQVTREKLIAYILEKQLDDGGWTLSGTKTDADMTGMALAALAPYYSKNEQVKAAVDKALVCLSTMQNADGGFGSVAEKGSATAESAAQVIVALTALGIDPNTDSRFVKNGRSVVNALCDYAVEGGGFKHVSFLGLNGMATEQGYYALAAYFRFLDGEKTSLYNMSDVKIKSAAETVESLIDAIGEVSYDAECKSRIDAARAAYDALSATDKAKVTNYKKLTKAEAEYAQLERDQKAAQRVIDLIDSIGYVSLNSENKILRARAAYNSLTYAQKKLVYNYSTLLYAEERLEELKIEQVEDLIDAIGTVTLDSKSKIERARAAYNALSNAAQKKVSNLNVLVAAEKAYDKLVKEAKEEEAAKRVNEVTSQIESISEDATVEELLDAILAFDTLTEEEKTASGKVEAVEALKKQIAEMIQTDVKTGISVSDVEWNIQLVVEKEQSAVQTGALQEKLGNNTLLGLWDIYLKDIVLSQEVQPDGTVLVKIPLTLLGDYSGFDGLAVVHYADDGTVEYLNSEIAEECVTFHATDFSYYAVVGYKGDSPLDGMINDEANGTVVTPWIITGCCAVVLLGVVLFLNGKSKKQKAGKYAE